MNDSPVIKDVTILDLLILNNENTRKKTHDSFVSLFLMKQTLLNNLVDFLDEQTGGLVEKK